MKNNLVQKSLPKGWYKARIGSVGEVVSGATPKTANSNFWGGSLVWITPKDLSRLKTKYAFDSERKISDLGFKSCSTVKIPANSLIMSSRAPIGYLAISKVESVTNQGCKSIIPKEGIDIEYLYYYLTHNIDDVKRLGSGSTFAEVGRSAVESVEIIVPTIQEQKKIAEILSSVDEEIQKVGELISATDKLKSALMTELFTKGIDHKKFKKTKSGSIPENWLIKNLSELALITRGGSPRPIESYITDDVDGLNWLKIGDVEQGAKYISSTSQKIKKEGLSKTTIVNSGDFILSNSMSFGRPYIMKISACIHDGWLAFKNIKTDLISKEFLYYLLSSNDIQNTFRSISAGSGVKNLKKETVSNVLVSLPLLEEQNRIVAVLSLVDEKLEISKGLKENLTLLKKGLMSDLLSGKVRVIK